MTVPVMWSVASMFVLNGSFLKWYYCYCFVCGVVMNSWLSHVILWDATCTRTLFFCSNNWVVVNGGQKPYYVRTLCMCVVYREALHILVRNDITLLTFLKRKEHSSDCRLFEHQIEQGRKHANLQRQHQQQGFFGNFRYTSLRPPGHWSVASIWISE